MSLAETWVPIPGFSAYEVSSLGRVRSWKPWRNLPVPRLRRLIDNDGYLGLVLQNDEGENKTRQVHVLVALAFLGPRPGRLDVCHNDGDPANNVPSNLRYDTRAANVRDMQEHGTANYIAGEAKVGAKLTEDAVREIRRRYAAGGCTHRGLASEYGVTHCIIGKVIRGVDWAGVTA